MYGARDGRLAQVAFMTYDAFSRKCVAQLCLAVGPM